MLNFQKNIEITNQYLQQAGDAMKETLSSGLVLGTNMTKCCLSAVEASTYGYVAYKFACSEIVGNLPILSISASAGLFPGAGLAYGVLSSVATSLVSHPISSFSLFAAYSFVKWTGGIENIKNTISSIGDVANNVVKVGTELYHASESAIYTVNSALKSYLLQGSDHDSEEANYEANVNLDHADDHAYLSNADADQDTIISAGDSLGDVNTGDYDFIGPTEISTVGVVADTIQ